MERLVFEGWDLPTVVVSVYNSDEDVSAYVVRPEYQIRSCLVLIGHTPYGRHSEAPHSCPARVARVAL